MAPRREGDRHAPSVALSEYTGAVSQKSRGKCPGSWMCLANQRRSCSLGPHPKAQRRLRAWPRAS
eukprot:2177188-Alexandrium_andersonii.AAC.1